MSRTYRELYRIEEPLGSRHVTIEEGDGLFRFTAWDQRAEREYDGITRTNRVPIRWSGLYRSAEDAEREARAAFAWLPAKTSN